MIIQISKEVIINFNFIESITIEDKEIVFWTNTGQDYHIFFVDNNARDKAKEVIISGCNYRLPYCDISKYNKDSV